MCPTPATTSGSTGTRDGTRSPSPELLSANGSSSATGPGVRGLCEVTATEGKSALWARVLESVATASPVPRVTVVQALPKSERSELAVDLATEAGADAIVPWQSARCVAKWVGPKADKGVAKWRSAAIGCRQAESPGVHPGHRAARAHQRRAIDGLRRGRPRGSGCGICMNRRRPACGRWISMFRRSCSWWVPKADSMIPRSTT